jgi:putative copper export protein
MWFQPMVYFCAVMWALAFTVFGVYLAVRRDAASVVDRVVGFTASLLVGGVGAAIVIGIFTLFEELI